jgi:hypothetical protein
MPPKNLRHACFDTVLNFHDVLFASKDADVIFMIGQVRRGMADRICKRKERASESPESKDDVDPPSKAADLSISPPLRPTTPDGRYFFDLFASWTPEQVAMRTRSFQSMAVERAKNQFHVTHVLPVLMAQFKGSYPEIFARYESELSAIKRECNFRRDHPSLKEEDARAGINWDRHIQETLALLDSFELTEKATSLREMARKLWVDAYLCPHTPVAQQVTELIEESKQEIACVSGEGVPADEFDVRQAAEAAVGYPHSACQEWESAAEAKTQEAETLDQVVIDYRHIHDISRDILASATHLRWAEINDPWYRFFFTDYKE